MTESENKVVEAMIDADLKTSKVSDAHKQALKERLIIKAQEQAEIKAIRGLDVKTGKRRPKITLGNGLQVNADAFDD